MTENTANKIETVDAILGGYDPMPVLNALSVCASAKKDLLSLSEVNCDKPLSEMTFRQVSHLANCGYDLNKAVYSSLLNGTPKKVNKMPRAAMEYSVELELKTLVAGLSELLALAKKSKGTSLTDHGDGYYTGCMDAYGNTLSRVEDILKRMG